MAVLELKGIDKYFYGIKVLNGVDFSLDDAEVHALLGENGAGKSTLIKIISGVYRADAGEMYYNGKRVHFDRPIDAIRAGISVIHQEISIFPDLSVAENLFVGHYKTTGLTHCVDFVSMKKEAQAIYDRLGMKTDITKKASELSVAERQMMVIARALLFNSRVIIMDEPTAALSLSEVETLFSTIEELKKQGVSIIYISHRMEELYRISDRVTVIRDGRYVATAKTGEVDRATLVSWMVGRSIENYYPKIEHEIGGALLKVENLSDGAVVKNVSFELRRGEILGFSGLAGAGRTEAARALVGLSKRISGTIILGGEPIEPKSYRGAMELGIVYVSEDRQGDGLVLPMSVKDNITLSSLYRNGKLGFINGVKDRDTAESYMKRLRIAAPDRNFEVKNLSGGNQQKVSLAKGLCDGPKIVILDEPTRGVDVGAKTEIYNLINELVAEGCSVIVISSDLPEIIGICDRVVVLRNGETVCDVSGDDINQEYILSRAIDA